MTSRRMPMLLLASALLVFGFTGCSEPPAEAPSDSAELEVAPETLAQPTLEAEAPQSEEQDDDDRDDDDQMAAGCMAPTDEVRDVLAAQILENSGTAGTAAKAPLDVNEMVYGTWEVNAVEVTAADGTQEVAVWATKVLAPSEWSSAAGAGDPLAFTVNEVAASMSEYDEATEEMFGRPVSMDDPEVMAALDCLAAMESDD